jgi:hypothetical protein
MVRGYRLQRSLQRSFHANGDARSTLRAKREHDGDSAEAQREQQVVH